MDATSDSKKLGAVKLSRVTFRATNRDGDPSALKNPAAAQSSRGASNVKPLPSEGSSKPTDTKKPTQSISLSGLLAAQRMTLRLKNQAALRRKARARTPNRKPINIINEQVPAGSANPAQRFPYSIAKELIQDFLTAKLRNVTYDPSTSADLTKNLCEDIKKIVRRVTPARYKLICNTAIGSKNQEDILVTSQCLWDSYSDNITSCSFQNSTMFCVVTVYAVYFE
ncbi:dynein light chain Tctex-type protein 2B-like [Hyla sarda]|uniref:dynein light chain Tctex-type protein 2B-like n=1 Tax=Hyla sarda TaxID=327740 RepID=UPI0024C2169C|nr:dynein light chain Tctex-type protein 2B-like [Hyla sarda]XP_056388137.1 dynein light chain Tctex-type protein 2B-like [Hyla sarda]XP_056388139.1 dynein light chain Tctex-type protein 2B-like [Hyla sarda]